MTLTGNDPFARITATVELAELCLLIVTGPDHQAVEALQQIRQRLPEVQEELWAASRMLGEYRIAPL